MASLQLPSPVHWISIWQGLAPPATRLHPRRHLHSPEHAVALRDYESEPWRGHRWRAACCSQHSVHHRQSPEHAARPRRSPPTLRIGPLAGAPPAPRGRRPSGQPRDGGAVAGGCGGGGGRIGGGTMAAECGEAEGGPRRRRSGGRSVARPEAAGIASRPPRYNPTSPIYTRNRGLKTRDADTGNVSN
ncbi:hypothetical protein SETIT_1G125400v2 [Setaria italica]|uniref:Uncharacterized protein n=1 Tax=Setaria italica TaxID=4555 RepID=A0A368PJZ4_SETIT|nr:hypothetical protein SETIT_1G125400v2 [Setaria italica]